MNPLTDDFLVAGYTTGLDMDCFLDRDKRAADFPPADLAGSDLGKVSLISNDGSL